MVFIAATSVLLLLSNCLPTSSWRIEKGGTVTPESSRRQEQRRTPPNAVDPAYVHPTARGGRAQTPGNDGAVVLVAKVHAATHPTPFETLSVPPLELRAQYYAAEENAQRYVVPGDGRRTPYEQEVQVKVWGAGGGGCDGGREATTDPIPNKDEEDGTVTFSEGSGGGYVDATFTLPVGETLHIVVGGGGGRQSPSSARGPPPTGSLGGPGGRHGGLPGRTDAASGGGGGGGLTTVSLRNGTLLAAAHGGDGGGGTAYCAAAGGAGARLRGEPEGVGGYINFAYVSSDDDARDGDRSTASCPGEPLVVTLSHDSVEFTWNHGSHHTQPKELYAQKYTVQLSRGILSEEGDTHKCSEEYKLHEHIPRSIDSTRHASTWIRNLEPSTPHCIHIEAFSVEGLSLGVQVLPFTTEAAPVNRWAPVIVKQASTISEKAHAAPEMNPNNDEDLPSASWCEYSPGRPTGRRGHSMTIVNDQVYIFGGATLKCVCEKQHSDDDSVSPSPDDAKPQCSSKNVYSDELWHYDPKTESFSQLSGEVGQPWPRGREQHSATALPDGNIIVIGGLSTSSKDLEIHSSSEKLLLADVWRMKDPHHILSRVFRGSAHSVHDGETVLPLELTTGHVTSHQLAVDFQNEDEELNQRCIVGIQVRVVLETSCLKDIEYIKLTGPGTKDVPKHNAPQSRDYEAKLFVSSMDSREHVCRSSSLDLLFSDDATESILRFASIPTSGMFRSATSLSGVFDGLPIRGKWKISIAQSHPMHPEIYTARLVDWEIKLMSKPCVARVKWEKLGPAVSSSSSFSPRRLHTAVAVDDNIFIAGGFSERRLDDLWRFNYDSNTLIELNNGATNTWPLNGQAAFLGQYGLLAYGGLGKHGPLQQGKDLWLLDLFQDDWVSVPIVPQKNIDDNRHFNNDIPYGRYLSSIGLLSQDTKECAAPQLIMFGGDGGLLHNAYSDSYGFMRNSFYNDVWLLSVVDQMPARQRVPGDCFGVGWNNTCGAKAGLLGGRCSFLDILVAAWCRQQYGSFWLS